jgi:hypothetical protein
MNTQYSVYAVETQGVAGDWRPLGPLSLTPEAPALLAMHLRKEGHIVRLLTWDQPREIPEDEWDRLTS